MKKKAIIGIILLLVLVIIVDTFYKRKEPQKSNLTIELKGPEILELEQGIPYQELGYYAHDDIEGDLTKKVTIDNTINPNQPGTYQITYTVKNSKNQTAYAKRLVKIKSETKNIYKPEYDNIDNTQKGWWTGNKKDFQRPETGAANTPSELQEYNAYYLGEDKKIIYLTFDEGSNDTYLDEIVDVLNEHQVKATFFLCRGYMESNQELMKKLVETGHSVGNHTANHIAMPTLATKENYEKYVNEIKSNEKTFQEITGVAMDKVYREPKGEYSFRSLAMIKDLGYKTYFWSAAYDDYHDDLSRQEALKAMMTRYHNGAIYLLHPKNKGNYEALSDFIKNMKDQGYEFGLVKDIETENQ